MSDHIILRRIVPDNGRYGNGGILADPGHDAHFVACLDDR